MNNNNNDNDMNNNSHKVVKRKSLAAGEARRDRFSRWREGTGRSITSRPFHIKGANIENIGKDSYGFDDIDDVFDDSNISQEVKSNEVKNVAVSSSPSVKQTPKQMKSTTKRRTRSSSRKSSKKRKSDNNDESKVNQKKQNNDELVELQMEDVVKRLDFDNMNNNNNLETDTSSSNNNNQQNDFDLMNQPELNVDDYDDNEVVAANSDGVVSSDHEDNSDVIDNNDINDDEMEEELKEQKHNKTPVSDKSKKKKKTPRSVTMRQKENMIRKIDVNNSNNVDDTNDNNSNSIDMNNDNNNDDDESSFDDEEEKVDNSKNKKRKKSETDSNRRKKKRRQTLQLIKAAKKAGIVDENDDNDDDGVRRSKRTRFPPLEYWRNERLRYEKVEDDPVSIFLPVLSKDHPVETPTKEPTPKRKKRKIKRLRKKKKTSSNDDSEDDDDSDDNVKRIALNPKAIVWDRDASSIVEKTVAKAIDQHKFVPLPQQIDPNSDEILGPQLLACKSLDEENFATGLLVIPPDGVKLREQTVCDEVFHVIAAPTNGLKVEMGTEDQQTKLILSKGDTFFVPSQNQYSFRNVSKSKPIKLLYVLVRRDDDDDDDLDSDDE